MPNPVWIAPRAIYSARLPKETQWPKVGRAGLWGMHKDGALERGGKRGEKIGVLQRGLQRQRLKD
eukprot:4036138-Pyramimonas_sp.AAC.1